MKKQIKKRFTISKITISNLNSEALDNVFGGTKEKSGYACDSRPWYTECVPCPISNECVSDACIPTN
ncbi:MAG: class I lanthipeptide [Acidobacteria bacterium]|jgi:hypothetical protein|nr:class I lanthipeptide [Acidobacteriota bacterium]